MEWGWSRGVYCAVYIVRGGGGVEVFIVQFGAYCEGWGGVVQWYTMLINPYH